MFNILPSIDIIFVYPKSSVAIKNGKREGTTEFAHKLNPFFAADKLLFEKRIKNKVNKHIMVGIINDLAFNTSILNLFMDTPLIYIYIKFCIIYNKKIKSRQKVKIMLYYVEIK